MVYKLELLKTKADCDAALVMLAGLRRIVLHGKEGVTWNAEGDEEAVKELDKKLAKVASDLKIARAGLAAMTPDDQGRVNQGFEVKALEVKEHELEISKSNHGAVGYLKSQIANARYDSDLVILADFDTAVNAKKAALPA